MEWRRGGVRGGVRWGEGHRGFLRYSMIIALQLKRHISTIHNIELCIPIVQTSYLYLQNYPNGGTECLYYAMYLIWCIKVNNVISLLAKLPEWWH